MRSQQSEANPMQEEEHSKESNILDIKRFSYGNLDTSSILRLTRKKLSQKRLSKRLLDRE